MAINPVKSITQIAARLWPYKKGKTLSESLKIMCFMAKDNEIDKDLLDLLMDSGLYLEYAKKFLKPEQIDQPNIEQLKAFYR